MRETVLEIYNSFGAIVFKVFLFAMCVYVLFVAYSMAHRAFQRKNKPQPKEIEDDVNEQW